MTAIDKRSAAEFLRKARQAAHYAFGVGILAIFVALVGWEIQDNWGLIVCWMNDETGQLGRTCAQHKIAETKEYEDAQILDVTGIAEITENVKRVEFTWQPKPGIQNPDPQSATETVTFRKYDDGWRISR